MEAMTTFKDNARDYIIAFDFDNTITVGDLFPDIGPLRKYAKEVMNFLYDIGVKAIIWTCRDKLSNPTDELLNDIRNDIAPMEEFLKSNGVKYHAINSCIEFAPFYYEARKIYAHMYVDDKGFGWMEHDDIMLAVLYQFLYNVMHVSSDIAVHICNKIRNGLQPNEIDMHMVRSSMRRCNG